MKPEPVPATPHICALLTSFNRCESTLDCLTKLEASAAQAGVHLQAVLADDASTDGTPQRVAERFAWVTVLHGNGSMFWNRGMRMAMQHAMAETQASALLWLNDDTLLLPDAIARLLAAAASIRQRHGRDGIVVGATCDSRTSQLTYGGNVAAGRWRPLTFRKVHSAVEPTACQTMNGNVVLIPMVVAHDVGLLDPVFEHAMGDLDYGLRATQRGHPIYVAPGFVGHCSNNPRAGSHRDASLSLRQRWRKITHRKELPPRSWLQLTRRHGGPLWPLYFAWPYLRVLSSGLLASFRGQRASGHHG